MTTKTYTYFERDVFQSSDWPLFNAESAREVTCPVPVIGVLSVACENRDVGRDVETMLLECANRLKSILVRRWAEGYRIWLFMAHSSWLDSNRVNKWKKLWKSLPNNWDLHKLILAREVLIERRDGIRYAGLAGVSPGDFDVTASKLIRSRAAAIIVSNRTEINSDEEVARIFHAAFGDNKHKTSSSIDWVRMAVTLCPYGDMVIRANGSYDEREASLDCFGMSSDFYNLFYTLD